MTENNNLHNKKIAVCYFGLVRTLKKVIDSQNNKLFNIIEKGGYEFEIFMHTWKTDDEEQYVWDKKIDTKMNYEDYKIINPKYYKIDSQDDFLKTININDYFNQERWDTHGDNRIKGEWHPQLIKNHLCALESMKRSFEMVEESGENFDYVIVNRPDGCFTKCFNMNDFNHFDEYPNGILVSKYESYEGYNDKFAIMRYDNAIPYCKRIDEIKEWREKHTKRIVSEKFVKFIIDKYYKKKKIDFTIVLIR